MIVDFYNHTTRATEQVEVSFRKDATMSSYKHTRWNIVRADNGRKLGWLEPVFGGADVLKRTAWSAHATPAAFRGDDLADDGCIGDEVPLRLFNGDSQFKSRSISHVTTREGGANVLVDLLARNQATALGWGRHPLVTRDERIRELLGADAV